MLNQTGGSKMDTLFKLVLIAVISILSFSIGAFVGKQVSDTEHRQALLESEHGVQRGTASVNPDMEEKPGHALSEEDIESLTEEFVKVEKEQLEKAHQLPNPVDKHKKENETHNADHGEEAKKGYADASGDYKKYNRHAKGEVAEHEESDSQAKNESHANESHEKHAAKEPVHKTETQMKVASAAERVAHNKAPTPDLKKVRQPDSVLPVQPTSSIGKYTVQVGSYATETEAQEYANKLKEEGLVAFYIPGKVKDKTWYRVNIGLFTTLDEAKDFRKQQMAAGKIKSSFIQKVVK